MKTVINRLMTVATTMSLTTIAIFLFLVHTSPEAVAAVACDMGTSNAIESVNCQSEFFPNP